MELPAAIKRKIVFTPTCWEWKTPTHNGYGIVSMHAHRFVYLFLTGDIPDGLQIDHLCRNRRCVNPAHLEPVTCRENLLRGETITAQNAAKTHCPQGHPYDAKNTWRGTRGLRYCKACRRLRYKTNEPSRNRIVKQSQAYRISHSDLINEKRRKRYHTDSAYRDLLKQRARDFHARRKAMA